VRLRLTPRDASFYDFFADMARQLVAGADLLAELLGADVAGRRRIAEELREAEHRTDEMTHALVQRMNSTFVTPLDREDLHALAVGLDDCMDHMDAAADRVVLYRLRELPDGVTELVAVLQRQAELTAAAMPRLRSAKDLATYWVELNRLENHADRVHRRLVADLFDRGGDPMLVLRVRDVADELAAVADAFERVATTVEGIAVKES
jgi:uncharacterized protein